MLEPFVLMSGRVNLHPGLHQECQGCEAEYSGKHSIQERFKAKKHVDVAAKYEEVGVDENLAKSVLATDANGRE